MRRFALTWGVLTLLGWLIAGTSAVADERILTIGNPGHPASLDPHRITGVWENRIVGDMLMGLTTEAADGSTVAGAAKSWEVSADGLTYTFTIREHSWSDGVPVTAEDFVYSFRRMLSGETTSPYAQFFWVIENARDLTRGDAEPEALGVSALDASTLQIRLSQPTAYFLGLLTHFAAFPVPRHAIEAHGGDWTAAGNMPANGAFMLAERVANDHVRLLRNPRFFDADAVALDGVIHVGQEDLDAQLSRFRAGELDILRDFPGGRTQWLRERLPEAVRTAPYLGLAFFAINHAREPLRDARVRRALSMALQREIIAERLLGSGEQPAWSLVPEGTANYTTPAMAQWRSLAPDERTAQARALMRVAGYGPDRRLSLQLRYHTSENDRRVAVAAQSMWREIFVDVELERAETAVHYASLQQGNFDLGLASWLAVYDDPQTFTLLLETASGPNNLGDYSNESYDALTAQAAASVDLAERARLLREAEAHAVREQALIPIYHHAARNLVAEHVTGWQDNLLDVHRSRFLGLRSDTGH
ncbi:MAG: peptide ABC transporter substrate-binding protein [Gammaproteobacteria bacterium]|nr:peptide ABC transporter substrate-binding protein [Gammaproteobacteria bacterium]